MDDLLGELDELIIEDDVEHNIGDKNDNVSEDQKVLNFLSNFDTSLNISCMDDLERSLMSLDKLRKSDYNNHHLITSSIEQVINNIKKYTVENYPNLSDFLSPEYCAKLISSCPISELAVTSSGNYDKILYSENSVIEMASRDSFWPNIDNRKADVIQLASNMFNPRINKTHKKLVRLVGNKAALCARIDFARSKGEEGLLLRNDVINTMNVFCEPPPARKEKVLDIPEEKKSKRRGGKRLRAQKEKYGLSEIQKSVKRVSLDVSNNNNHTMTYMNGDEESNFLKQGNVSKFIKNSRSVTKQLRGGGKEKKNDVKPIDGFKILKGVGEIKQVNPKPQEQKQQQQKSIFSLAKKFEALE